MIGFEQKRKLSALFFIAPWLLGFLLFTLYPLFYSLYVTFCSSSLGSLHWVGFDNYIKIFSELNFWRSGMYTLLFGLLSTPVTLCFALLLALLINQKLRGINFFRAIYFLPVVAASDVISTTAGTILFRRILVIQIDLSRLGIIVSEETKLLLGIIMTLMILSLWRAGLQMLIFLMGLINVPQESYEAADIDGATQWHKFWWVTIPSIAPIILINILITVIESFTSLTTSMQIMTRGQMQLFIWDYINQLFYRQNEYGLALAAVWVFIMVILLIIGLVYYLFNRKVNY